MYSILVGAVALAVWYGGFGPGFLSVIVGWAGAYLFVVRERADLGMTAREAWIQWGIALAVALGMLWVSLALRRGRARSAEAADNAEESVAGLATLQRLSSLSRPPRAFPTSFRRSSRRRRRSWALPWPWASSRRATS